MRYTVGQTTAFLQIKYKAGSLRFGAVYLPWEDDLESITVLGLTCTEHHKVPGEWDDEIKYDGFIFSAPDAKVFHNQYPRASYGQLSDACDWRVNEAPLTHENVNDRWEDAGSYLNNILRGLRHIEKDRERIEDADLRVEALTKFYDTLVSKLEESGFEVKESFHVFKFTDGRPDEVSDWREVTVTKKEE